ncbi:response regulator [soil metagenome]
MPAVEVARRGSSSENVVRPSRILVVDDFLYDRESLCNGLRERGYEVTEMAGGEDALAAMKDHSFDLVMLDREMPMVDGLEVLQEIRQVHSPLDLPVIMVTGRDDSTSVVEGLKNGANDYVTKPVDMDVICARIETQLSILKLRTALQHEQEFSENVIESAHEIIIFAVDSEHRVTLFNSAAERIFGYAREEIIGQPLAGLFCDVREYMRIHDEWLQEKDYSGEVKKRRKNGEVFISRLSTSMLRDKSGKTMGIVGIAADLSEVKRLEEERERLISQKEEFLAMASHDLHSPLTAILGFTELLSTMGLPEGNPMECLSSIRDSAWRMQKILQDFVDFHALETGTIWCSKAPMQIAEIVDGVLKSASDGAKRKNIRLTFEGAEDAPMVFADGDRIERVVRNLIGNAIKFCPRGSEICVRTSTKDGGLEVAVIDNGPGLTDEDLQKVFGKYARLSNKPTAGEKSNGLGLAICKQLIELHGGHIEVRNNLDAGATFSFWLPVSCD